MTDPLFMVIPYPTIDPVAIEIGPLVIRWYALAYVAGLVVGWWYIRRIVDRRARAKLGDLDKVAADVPEDDRERVRRERIRRAGIMTKQDVDDAVFWVTLGVILGGRLGYVIFYKPLHFLQNPEEIIQIWGGGMSFHGGLIGVIAAMLIFGRVRGISGLSVADLGACATPIGLGLGRLANFINGELWGRPTDVSWAMVFPADPSKLPRHPSQLYEAFLEGLVLFLVLWVVRTRFRGLDRPGEVGGWFLAGYGIARFTVEFVREPDAHLGLLWADLSMGQWLSIPLILFGAFQIWRARVRAATPGAASA